MTLEKEVLLGMWRYHISRRFKKHLRAVALQKLCLVINSNESASSHIYGTSVLNQDCPFFHIGYCLSPDKDPEYDKLEPLRKKAAMGCYIFPFCKEGYHTYQNMKAWIRRVKI